ncbi:GNAT family N-acetyltransferase [Aeromicrobium sp. Leaf350]|uniref:GNAT family N-acetyltransferase n=1 Tax=Aeromicrobium sp. Leaf350 TaxID=2876565 RepID=UPI001E56F565|nr:GNAT family N-acetyltransferase [Aeromicrobium sp. Leaf350]
MTDVQVDVVEPDHADARAAVSAYLRELDERFSTGFDPEQAAQDEVEFTGERGLFLVARSGGAVVGCGALRWLGPGIAEIKRMWVDPERRGLGIAGRLLSRLESEAQAHGRPVVRLDTNAELEAAIAMYRRAGYLEVPRYNDNPYAQHWFEKRLDA